MLGFIVLIGLAAGWAVITRDPIDKCSDAWKYTRSRHDENIVSRLF